MYYDLATRRHDLSCYPQATVGEIEVTPFESKYLSTAHASGELEKEQLVVSFLFGTGEEATDLGRRQHLHLSAFLGR